MFTTKVVTYYLSPRYSIILLSLVYFWVSSCYYLIMHCIELLNIVLVIAIISATFLQLQKYLRENTKITISYDDEIDVIILSAISFCPHYLEILDDTQRKMTFEEWYREKELNTSDFNDKAIQYVCIASGYVHYSFSFLRTGNSSFRKTLLVKFLAYIGSYFVISYVIFFILVDNMEKFILHKAIQFGNNLITLLVINARRI